MALYSNGKLVDSNLIFSEAQALPNNTSANSTNAVHFGACRSGKLEINVVAATAISIESDTSKALTIKVEYGTTSSPSSVLYDTLYTRTASGSDITFAAGDIICQYVIPRSLAAAYDYCELVYTTSDNESSEKVDAFIAIIT
jgi:hypothetical protein